MFVEERQALIIKELQEKGRVKVKELSAKFKVTEDLIRKDLTALEEQGQLKKTYGFRFLISRTFPVMFPTCRTTSHIPPETFIWQRPTRTK